jgi:hypothetical protein
MPADTPDTPDPDQEDANDPMITTSLRLPQSVLDHVRLLAAQHGMKPTALIRRWIERACAREMASAAPNMTVDIAWPTVNIEVLMRQVVHEELQSLRDAVAGLVPPPT